ncbi:MAG: hypothetical protein DI556_15860 [Rhodovulum sulfidophilum]|uniref:Uncharacterized protein n=1 Tax=Rhodovulum sulfidophilum TaxID=35806 RepID=A0A2W5N381_RHOSU|nr:MAG: hypothetical protein DI556_15860 [Rhodovulum sulfidophilum]
MSVVVVETRSRPGQGLLRAALAAWRDQRARNIARREEARLRALGARLRRDAGLGAEEAARPGFDPVLLTGLAR